MDSPAAQSSPRRRIRRRWRVPPAILHGPEALEGAGLLDEFPGATGLILWQSIRDVTLWADTPPAERAGLFSAGAERNRIAALLSATLDVELEQPLGLITAMVGQPGRVSAERVALSCRRIAQWAENNGHLATALAFAQAGAVTCPGNAAAAFKVGQIARRRAEYVRAETWFRRAIALARQEGDWTSYSLGFAGLGTLYMQRGNFPKARQFHLRRLRAAKRHGLRDVMAGAHHDLFVIAFDSGLFDDAQSHARAALDAYGPGNCVIPRLAHDVAFLWILQGHFARALPVLVALLPHTKSLTERLIASSNMARAAGALGDVETFEWARREVMDVLRSEGAGEQAAEALLEVARGAMSLRLWPAAMHAAEQAQQVAEARQESRIILAVEGMLQALQSERSVIQQSEKTTNELPTDDARADELADDFVASLAGLTLVS
jgi:tetratricopeptide (TPR) repeat protein